MTPRVCAFTLSFAAAILAAFPVSAETTNVVDIAALAALAGKGVCTTNGWEASFAECYAGDANVKLGKKEEYLISPEFEAPIRKIILKVKSSSQSGRKLAFIPQIGSDFRSEHQIECDYSPTKDTYVWKTCEFADEVYANRFKVALTYVAGTTTGWGFSELKIVTGDSLVRPDAPTSVAAANITGNAFTARWQTGEGAVANQVDIYKIVTIEESGTVEESYDFENEIFTNTGANSKKIDDKITGVYGKLSGVWLYAPANSTSVLQLSTGKDLGLLIHSGFESYEDLTMALDVKRYTGDKEETQIGYIDAEDGTTNSIATVELGDEFARKYVSLAGVPDNAQLIINAASTKSNRRVLIDNLEFISDYVVPHTETNFVKSVRTDQNGARVLKLDRDSDYIFSVTSFNADGVPSEPSGFVPLKTLDRNDSMIIRVR